MFQPFYFGQMVFFFFVFLYKNIIQFYNINHISQADFWIRLKFYEEFLDILLYLG